MNTMTDLGKNRQINEIAYFQTKPIHSFDRLVDTCREKSIKIDDNFPVH